jgi:hypothetical protein
MGFEVLQIVDVVLGFLLMLAGGLMLWRPSGRLMWPRRLRHDPRSLRWRGVAPLIVGTGVATTELLILTGNAQAIGYVFLPVTGASALVALGTVWIRWRAARAANARQLGSPPAQRF